jgi:hypothetical protein
MPDYIDFDYDCIRRMDTVEHRPSVRTSCFVNSFLFLTQEDAKINDLSNTNSDTPRNILTGMY